ncbi:MAG: tryptophan synthase subunit beta, partial [Alphaproteobacteria bacterium]
MQKLPDASGHFGGFGGRYVSETLMPALLELETAYARIRRDPGFKRELRELLAEYVGRPTPLTHAARLSDELGGA